MPLSEKAKASIEEFRNKLQHMDVDDLDRYLDPTVNPRKGMQPSARRAAQELIEEKQLRELTPSLDGVLTASPEGTRPSAWRKQLRRLSEAELLYVAHDIQFASPHQWAKQEAIAEVKRRARQRDDWRFLVSTAIAIVALIVSIVAIASK